MGIVWFAVWRRVYPDASRQAQIAGRERRAVRPTGFELLTNE